MATEEATLRTMLATDWETCPEVERDPEKLGGVPVFRHTRLPLYALFANLRDGATVEEFVEWFPGVDRAQVNAVLDHAVKSLQVYLVHENTV